MEGNWNTRQKPTQAWSKYENSMRKGSGMDWVWNILSSHDHLLSIKLGGCCTSSEKKSTITDLQHLTLANDFYSRSPLNRSSESLSLSLLSSGGRRETDEKVFHRSEVNWRNMCFCHEKDTAETDWRRHKHLLAYPATE